MPFRADPIVTLTYAVTLAAPVVAWASIGLARAHDHARHRRLQVRLLVVCWLAVIALEARIRVAGGSGAFIADAPEAVRAWAYRLLIVHISVAIATYLMWTWLAVTSWRRYRQQLPGSFSRTHRTLGRIVAAGLTFTAVSATGMFVLAFVV